MWFDLIQVGITNRPWAIIGDFNAVIGSHEKMGGSPPPQIACDEFAAFSNTYYLVYMDTVGADFMLTNGREGDRHTKVRLDRVFCNAEWYSTWSDTSCRSLVREFSNHNPLLLNFDIYVRRYPKTFRFLSCWLQHENFVDMMRENWKTPMDYIQNPMLKMMLKLKRV